MQTAGPGDPLKVLRTPDQRFESLPGYAFEPHYAVLATADQTLRMHYLDEGSREAPTIVLLHGQPSWSYLYRETVPDLVGAGLRVLAPDLIGFGRSDKPAEIADYTYARHVEWLDSWLRSINLGPSSTFFVHDWGGFIGLRVLALEPERFERVIASNTGLPDGVRLTPGDLFYTWRQFVRGSNEFAVGNVIQLGSVSELPDETVGAYDAPYPDESYKNGVRAFPELVPTGPEHPEAIENQEAWEALESFSKPFLTLFGDSDPMNAGNDEVFQRLIPGAAGQPHARLEGGGHFMQEDVGAELSRRIIDFAVHEPAGLAAARGS